MNATASSIGRRAAIALAFAGAAAPARAQPAWPSRPITLLIPFGPGGPTHHAARLLARHLSPALGVPVTVQARTARGGMEAACAAAEAAPDGHTLLFATNGVFVMGAARQPCAVPLHDHLAPVGLLASAPHLLCIAAGSGFRTLDDLVQAARQAPGAVRHLAAFPGDPSALPLAAALGLRFGTVPVPGGSAAEAGRALARGEAEFAFLDSAGAVPAIAAGTLRGLAIAAPERAAVLPEVPTFAELGLPGLAWGVDYALFAPAGTPEAVLDHLMGFARAAVESPAAQRAHAALGLRLPLLDRTRFPAYLAAERARWEALLREAP